MKNDYDADREDKHLLESGNGGLRWMSMLVMVLVVFGFFSLVWYAYNATTGEKQQEAIAIIAPEHEQYKQKPEETGGLPIENKDIEAYQLMRRQPNLEEDVAKVERLLPENDEPVIQKPVENKDPSRKEELKQIDQVQSEINAPIKPGESTGQPADQPEVNNASTEGEILVSDAASRSDEENEEAELPKISATKEPVAAPVEEEITAAIPVAPAPVAAPSPKPSASAPVVTPQPLVSPQKPVPAPLTVQPPKPVAPPPAPKPAPSPVAAAPASGSGTYVQLAALRSSTEAARLWEGTRAKNADILANYSHYVEPVQVAGQGTFYRLRIKGFASRDAALSVCTTLKSRGQDCLVSR